MRGLTQRALAAAAGGISAQAICRYEKGQDVPSSSVLIRLADALRVRTDYFFRKNTVVLGAPVFRVGCNLPDREKAEIHSIVADELERYSEIERILGKEAGDILDVPQDCQDPVRDISDVEQRAECIREYWKVGLDALGSLTELFEAHAIRVVCVNQSDDFDGCTYENHPPVIVVNCNRPSDRRRFSLAHELGHIVLRFPDDWDDHSREKAINRFAGAFLVPADTARMELGIFGQLNLYELRILREKYGLSVQSWIHRAEEVGSVPKSSCDAFRAQLKNAGLYNKELGKPLETEKSDRHERLVVGAFCKGIISQSKAANLLAMGIEEFDAMLTETPLPVEAA
jgi:Zn-dependent peptidase ImmA (M78 family)/DNA-binding XRE family transcriptional regulator